MSTRDQLAVASLWGHAERCVAKRTPVDEALAGLREITTRPDLLAQAAGLIAGSGHPEDATYSWHIGAARLLVQVGADRELLPRWIAEGRRNVSKPAGWGTQRVWPTTWTSFSPRSSTTLKADRAEQRVVLNMHRCAPQ